MFCFQCEYMVNFTRSWPMDIETGLVNQELQQSINSKTKLQSHTSCLAFCGNGCMHYQALFQSLSSVSRTDWLIHVTRLLSTIDSYHKSVIHHLFTLEVKLTEAKVELVDDSLSKLPEYNSKTG
jgi:hypothetical protein